MIRQYILVLIIIAWLSPFAIAGPIEIEAIRVVPSETQVGRFPEITGSVKASKDLPRGEVREIIVIASLVRPDHVMKSWTWKDVIMRPGDIRSFAIPKEYDMKLAGSYKVDFNIYSKDMSPVYKLSTMFIAVDPSLQSGKYTTGSVRIEKASEQAAVHTTEYQHFGIGAYANTLNSTGGATILLWPFKYVGLQGSYSTGSFTITEGRVLARFSLSSGINSYLGAGYISVATERSVEVLDVKEKFHDSGVSGVIGVEMPLTRALSCYLELNAASINLKKEVTSGSITGTATVKYAPVTIGIGIVYYLF